MTETSSSHESYITLHFSGDVESGEPATRDDPGFDTFVESFWLDDATVGGKSLFKDVDVKNPEVQRIIANLVLALYDDLESNLLDAYHRQLA